MTAHKYEPLAAAGSMRRILPIFPVRIYPMIIGHGDSRTTSFLSRIAAHAHARRIDDREAHLLIVVVRVFRSSVNAHFAKEHAKFVMWASQLLLAVQANYGRGFFADVTWNVECIVARKKPHSILSK